MFSNKRPAELPRHTTFYEIWDALGEIACPICFLRQKGIRKYMDDTFYENVNDPGLRARLHESLGFCDEALELALEAKQPLGMSIIYAALAKDVAKRIDNNENLAPARACPMAERAADIEERYLSEFALRYQATDLQERHAASFGFCIAHLGRVVTLFPKRELRWQFLTTEAQKFRAFAAELNLFVKKNDYRNKEPFGAEANAWMRAAKKFHRLEP
jgi:hypothetical protein